MYKYILTLFLCFIMFNSNVKANELIKVKLSKCVDGDTAWFYLNNEEIKARFLAIDTPESTNKIEKYGKKASEYTCNELKQADKIEIEYDDNSDLLDKYDRHLVWVFVDGELLQNKLIINGLAEVKYLYGNYKYTSSLKESEIIAKNKKLNIWSNESNNYDNYIIILIAILFIILYIFSNKYRKKFNKKVKNYIYKKIGNLK